MSELLVAHVYCLDDCTCVLERQQYGGRRKGGVEELGRNEDVG
jgi:hypothetical protein